MALKPKDAPDLGRLIWEDPLRLAGRADLILFPSLEAGNATVKAWNLHGAARTASLTIRATVPGRTH